MTTTPDALASANPRMRRNGHAFIDHSPAFRRRRAVNWLTLGFTYAAMYMGRYNLSFANKSLSNAYGWDKTQIGAIISAALLIYGLSAMFNGPISDRIGGRRSMLIGACGSVVFNLLFGLGAYLGFLGTGGLLIAYFATVWSLNSYFQSYSALSLIKVNSGFKNHAVQSCPERRDRRKIRVRRPFEIQFLHANNHAVVWYCCFRILVCSKKFRRHTLRIAHFDFKCVRLNKINMIVHEQRSPVFHGFFDLDLVGIDAVDRQFSRLALVSPGKLFNTARGMVSRKYPVPISLWLLLLDQEGLLESADM
jgi:hypothetical protein